MNARALYPPTILEHAASPRRAVMPAAVDAAARGENPLCGDRVEVGVRLDGSMIADLGVRTRGCALCVASGSLMSERAVAAEIGAVRELARRFAADLEPGASDDPGDLGALIAFRELREHTGRKRCALLPWEALLEALDEARP